jgi:hypothetical protein
MSLLWGPPGCGSLRSRPPATSDNSQGLALVSHRRHGTLKVLGDEPAPVALNLVLIL